MAVRVPGVVPLGAELGAPALPNRMSLGHGMSILTEISVLAPALLPSVEPSSSFRPWPFPPAPEGPFVSSWDLVPYGSEFIATQINVTGPVPVLSVSVLRRLLPPLLRRAVSAVPGLLSGVRPAHLGGRA